MSGKNPLVVPAFTIIMGGILVTLGWFFSNHSPQAVVFLTGCAVFTLLSAFLVHRQNSLTHKLITQQNEESIRLKKLEQALEQTSNHVVITDPDGLILYANQAAQRITGYSFTQMQGQTPRLWGRQMPSQFYTQFWYTIKTLKKTYLGELVNKRQNGQKYSAQVSISPILTADHELLGFIGIEEDITLRVQAQTQLRDYANKLERLNRLMVGRELKMAQLKKQLAEATSAAK